MNEENKILKKAGWAAVYGLVTYGSIKSEKVGAQIVLGFFSAYAFNEILR